MNPARSLLATVFLVATLCGAAGCGAENRRVAPGFDARVPIKVAVLPFVDRSCGDSVLALPFTTLIDLAPFISDSSYDRERAATILRAGVEEHLHRTALDRVHGAVVDSLLGHRMIDPLKAYEGDRAAAARSLAEAVGADAVLLGEVTAWDRDFYVVESILTVGLRLELRDGGTGAILFESEVRDWKHAGISKLPVSTDATGGAQAVVGNAWKGLANTGLGELARDVARAALTGLAPGDEESRLARAPEIRFVGHDARAGLRAGDELTVVAIGDPGARASVRLGPEGRAHPMTESAPGCYRATLIVPPAARALDGRIEARLVGRALRASTMTVLAPALRRDPT